MPVGQVAKLAQNLPPSALSVRGEETPRPEAGHSTLRASEPALSDGATDGLMGYSKNGPPLGLHLGLKTSGALPPNPRAPSGSLSYSRIA